MTDAGAGGPVDAVADAAALAVAAAVRVVVVDDHAVFAQSVAGALAEEDGFEVVGVAGNAAEARPLVHSTRPDVVLLDFRLPDVAGAAFIAELRRLEPATRVVVLSAVGDDRTVVAALEAGCIAFLTKDQRLEDVVGAVRAAAVGESVIPPAVLGRILPRVARGARGPAGSLTPREREVLDLLAAGHSNQAIADRMVVSLNTVRNHVQRILSKLGAHSRLEAVAIAIRTGVLPGAGSGP